VGSRQWAGGTETCSQLATDEQCDIYLVAACWAGADINAHGYAYCGSTFVLNGSYSLCSSPLVPGAAAVAATMFGDKELAAALGRPRIRAALAEIRANPLVGHDACLLTNGINP
jgi:hypothetical protein